MPHIQGNWIVPILEDIREFAVQTRRKRLARDIQTLLTVHGPSLTDDKIENTDVLSMLGDLPSKDNGSNSKR